KNVHQIDSDTAAPQIIGDMTEPREYAHGIRHGLGEPRPRPTGEREKDLADQQAAREKIIEQAEQVSQQDPEKTQWKHSTAKMRELFDEWRRVQKAGPRLPRATEEALWKRFRSARNTFEKNRRAFFSQLDAQNAEAKKIKEDLIARAEALQNSTD